MKTQSLIFPFKLFTSLIFFLFGAMLVSSAYGHEGTGTMVNHVIDNYDRQHQRNNQCVDYEFHTRGGDGGIRLMHNIGNYKLIKHGVYRGRECGRNRLAFELSKRHPGTKVALKIDGKHYYFDSGEPAHKYINHWYRKYVQIDLSHQTSRATNHGSWGKDRHTNNNYEQNHERAKHKNYFNNGSGHHYREDGQKHKYQHKYKRQYQPKYKQGHGNHNYRHHYQPKW